MCGRAFMLLIENKIIITHEKKPSIKNNMKPKTKRKWSTTLYLSTLSKRQYTCNVR